MRLNAYVVSSFVFGMGCVVLAVAMPAFVHGIPLLGLIAVLILSPSLGLGALFELRGDISTETLAFVFVVQFLSFYVFTKLFIRFRCWLKSDEEHQRGK